MPTRAFRISQNFEVLGCTVVDTYGDIVTLVHHQSGTYFRARARELEAMVTQGVPYVRPPGNQPHHPTGLGATMVPGAMIWDVVVMPQPGVVPWGGPPPFPPETEHPVDLEAEERRLLTLLPPQEQEQFRFSRTVWLRGSEDRVWCLAQAGPTTHTSIWEFRTPRGYAKNYCVGPYRLTPMNVYGWEPGFIRTLGLYLYLKAEEAEVLRIGLSRGTYTNQEKGKGWALFDQACEYYENHAGTSQS